MDATQNNKPAPGWKDELKEFWNESRSNKALLIFLGTVMIPAAAGVVGAVGYGMFFNPDWGKRMITMVAMGATPSIAVMFLADLKLTDIKPKVPGTLLAASPGALLLAARFLPHYV